MYYSSPSSWFLSYIIHGYPSQVKHLDKFPKCISRGTQLDIRTPSLIHVMIYICKTFTSCFMIDKAKPNGGGIIKISGSRWDNIPKTWGQIWLSSFPKLLILIMSSPLGFTLHLWIFCLVLGVPFNGTLRANQAWRKCMVTSIAYNVIHV